MPIELRIEGAEQLAALSKRLHAAGNKGKRLKKELRATILKEARPVGRFVAVSAGSDLPHRGGLGYTVGGANISISAGTTSVSMKLKAKGYDLAAINRGRLRHPVFGHRENWVTQKVEKELFTKPFKAQAPRLRQRIIRATDAVAKRIEG